MNEAPLQKKEVAGVLLLELFFEAVAQCGHWLASNDSSRAPTVPWPLSNFGSVGL
jgi:hypothetical protein